MPSPHPGDARTYSLPKIAESEEDLTSLRQHLNDLLEGAAFKNAYRSGQFLKYIVEQAIAGHGDALKERLIGVELFGRSPSYHTGDDAIVRVTASDVRRRLLQHYGTYGSESDFRITVPQRSYIPEITRGPGVPKEAPAAVAPAGHAFVHVDSHISGHGLDHVPGNGSGHASTEDHADPAVVEQLSAQEHATAVTHTEGKVSVRSRVWLAIGLVLTVLNLALAGGIFLMHRSAAMLSPRSVFPWSVLFAPSHLTHLITSDPNVEQVQDICGHTISVSDYANRNYIPETTGLSPETIQSCRLILSAEDASSVDPGIVARISALAQQASVAVSVRAARNFEMTDLKTDDNYILLGSPRSNPWSALFNDQLDFHFVYDKALSQEFIRNFRPRGHELTQYIPTAMGGGTGKSFAIVAFLQNLDQNGQVLLLAGTNAEGTEAASSFVTGVSRLSAALQSCGVSGSQSHFELLLQVDTMAGSPNKISLVTCHALSGSAR